MDLVYAPFPVNPHRRFFAPWWALAAALFAPTLVPAAEAAGIGVAQAVRGDHNDLFVRVSVNGDTPKWWLVDTGAPVCLLSNSQQARLKLPSPAAPDIPHTVKNLGRDYPVVVAASFKVAGVEVGPRPLVVESIDAFLNERSSQIGGPLAKGGLLGLDALTPHGAVINCRTQQIFLSLQPGTLPVARENYEKLGYTAVPMTVGPHGHLLVSGTIGGEKYRFIVDTGAGGTILQRSIQRKGRIPVELTNVRVAGPYAGMKDSRYDATAVPGFKLGDHDVSDVRVGFADVPALGVEPGEAFGGLLGAELLWAHGAIIDLGHRTLYLRPDLRRRRP